MPIRGMSGQGAVISGRSMRTDSTEGGAMLGYLAVVSRWKWVVIGVTLTCLGAGFAYVVTSTPLYRATAKLLYVPPVTISNPLIQSGSLQAYQQPDIGMVSAMVASTQVTERGFKLLEGKDTSAGYLIEVRRPADSAGNISETVIGVDAVSSSPETAQDAAGAVAQAFVDVRRDTKAAQVEEALAAVSAALKSYSTASERESTEYEQLKQSEQALRLQLQSLSSDFTVIAAPDLPTEPFSPRKRHTFALAGSLGVILGLVLAFLLEQLDTRVRSERQMSETLGMPVLGHLPPLVRRPPAAASVQMLSDPSGPMAEAIRVLRGNLSFTGVDSDIRSLIVTSSVRTEGKSVTSSNLAVALALSGQRVALVDADFRRPRVHTYMRVSNGVGLSSVVARRAELFDALISVSLEARGGEGEMTLQTTVREAAPVRVMSSGSGRAAAPAVRYPTPEAGRAPLVDADVMLRVLPSGPLPPNPGEMAASQRLGEIIHALGDTVDIVILDTPPLLEVGDAAAMASRVDGMVFVVNMDKVRWPLVERSRAQLEQFPCRKLGMVVVAAKHSPQATYRYQYRADKDSGT